MLQFKAFIIKGIGFNSVCIARNLVIFLLLKRQWIFLSVLVVLIVDTVFFTVFQNTLLLFCTVIPVSASGYSWCSIVLVYFVFFINLYWELWTCVHLTINWHIRYPPLTSAFIEASNRMCKVIDVLGIELRSPDPQATKQCQSDRDGQMWTAVWLQHQSAELDLGHLSYRYLPDINYINRHATHGDA